MLETGAAAQQSLSQLRSSADQLLATTDMQKPMPLPSWNIVQGTGFNKIFCECLLCTRSNFSAVRYCEHLIQAFNQT